jgi:hypothetical protein
MNRNSILGLGVVAILAVGPFTLGCDSIVGDTRSSTDGGICSVPGSGDAAGSSEVAMAWDQAGLDASDETQEIDGRDDVPSEPPRLGYDAAEGIDGGKNFVLDGARDLPAQSSYDVPVDLSKRDIAATLVDVSLIGNQDASPDARGADASDTGTDKSSLSIYDSAVPDARDAGDLSVDGLADANPALNVEVAVDIAEVDDAAAIVDGWAPPVDVAAPVAVKSVSAGGYHTCALRTDGTVSCWGKNSDGQGTPPPRILFSQIAADNNFTCGLEVTGTATCWGNNAYGQGTVPAGHYLQIAAGSAHTCAVKTGGTVACWGYNTSGQCVPPTSTFTQLAAGSAHSCGILTGSTVVCWGDNTYTQTAAPSGSFSQVSAYGYHSCAIRSDATIACWGSNSFGESKPPSGTFLQVGVGYWHACGLRSDGTVACWGDNSYGQSSPASGVFTQVSAGMYHTCGVRSDGVVACWGDNSFGQSAPL